MRAGDLDRKVTLLRLDDKAQEASGEPVERLVPFATVWAAVIPAEGGERFGANQRFATATVLFRIRWRPGVQPLNGISYDGLEYDVVRVDEIGRREGLEIHATTRTERR